MSGNIDAATVTDADVTSSLEEFKAQAAEPG